MGRADQGEHDFDLSIGTFVATAMVNLKLAFRTLFKAPFVTTVAIVSLALGIGANAAIFSLFDQALLRALPAGDPDRLVNLASPGPKHGSQSCNQAGSCESVFSYPMFRDLEHAQTAFTGIAAHVLFGANLAYRGQTLNGEGMLVSGSYFPVLGLRPSLGRLLTPADNEAIGANLVVVLSHNYWKTRLGGSPTVLNETMVVNGQSMTIVGVAPAGFVGTTLGARPHVFVPVTMRGLMSPGFNGFDNRRSYWAYLFARLKPGGSRVPILAGSNWGSSVAVEGFTAGPDDDTDALFNEIGPGYFGTLGIPLMSGREFTLADAAGALKVTIVNEAFAKKFNLGREAVGKRLGTSRGEQPDIEIVGVVQNAKYSEVKQEVPAQFFIPYRQDTTLGAINFYVRTAQQPQQILRTVPGVIANLDPTLPVENLKTMPQQVRENVYGDRVIGTLSSTFAALATLLAAVGLYGVLSYTVAQRTREIGVRMALGADARRVRGMVLGQVARMTLVGGLVGIAAAIGLGRAAGSLLFGLEEHDPVVIAIAAVILAIVALSAGYIPAYRASRVEPMRALRYE